mgnify:CR=1 FL=1
MGADRTSLFRGRCRWARWALSWLWGLRAQDARGVVVAGLTVDQDNTLQPACIRFVSKRWLREETRSTLCEARDTSMTTVLWGGEQERYYTYCRQRLGSDVPCDASGCKIEYATSRAAVLAATRA